MILNIENQTLHLDASGAVYWKEKKALLIADAHLGKVNHFRKNGFPIPLTLQFGFYHKMNKLLESYPIKTVYFLGDLFHSEKNRAWYDFEDWVKAQSRTFVLIVGNHDIIAKQHFTQLGIVTQNTVDVEPFSMTHYPAEKEAFNLCGHIHPGVRLKGKGLQRLKVPCFFKRKNQLILPAFGAFTGVHLMQPKQGDQIYALSGENVIPIHLK